jgi:hypothetical protein
MFAAQFMGFHSPLPSQYSATTELTSWHRLNFWTSPDSSLRLESCVAGGPSRQSFGCSLHADTTLNDPVALKRNYARRLGRSVAICLTSLSPCQRVLDMAAHFFTNIPTTVAFPLSPRQDCPFSLKHLEAFHTFSGFLTGTFLILAIVCLSFRLSRPRRGKQDGLECREHFIVIFIYYEFRQCEPRKQRKLHGWTTEMVMVYHLTDHTNRRAMVTAVKLTNSKT